MLTVVAAGTAVVSEFLSYVQAVGHLPLEWVRF
jgi:hypothetical protein